MTASVCKSIREKKIVDRLTKQWQIEHNPYYSDLMDFATERGFNYASQYDSLEGTLSSTDLNNGLLDEENDRLFRTQFMDEAIYLILKGLARMGEAERNGYKEA